MPDSRKDYSGFDRMSTEMLEEILRADFESSSDKESDMDAILYIMEVIAKRNQEAGNREYPDAEQAWKSFNENYRFDMETAWYEDEEDLAGKPETTIPKKEKPKKRKRLLHRCIGFAAVIALVICCASFTPNAVGYNFWQIFAQWTSETFGFASKQAGEQTEPVDKTDVEYSSLQEALDAYGIQEKLVPTWIPEDYELQTVEVTEIPEMNCFTATYQNEDKYITIKVNNIYDGNYITFEKNDSVVEVIEIDRIEHYIMSNTKNDKVAWHNGNNECFIVSSSVSRDELKKMVQSIYKR